MSRSSASRMRELSIIENRCGWSRRQFLELSVAAHSIEPHAGDADVQAALPIERHAQRLPADMGVDLPFAVIRREKADDLAVAKPQ